MLFRSSEGGVIDGDAVTVAKITDIWTFVRDTRSSDLNWQLIDTDSED